MYTLYLNIQNISLEVQKYRQKLLRAIHLVSVQAPDRDLRGILYDGFLLSQVFWGL